MISRSSIATLLRLLLCIVCAQGSLCVLAAETPGKIGIFDLQAIHAVPLDPEIVSKKEDDKIVIEKIRFTGRPGVRAFMVMTYYKGMTSRPVSLVVRNYGVSTMVAEAKNTFVGVSVCATCGNHDASKDLTVGGPPFNQFYTDDPEQSWYYHYIVALTRAIDYLATRPEVDMKNIMVQGYSTSGYVTTLLHAVENRPVCYYTWHGTGYYTDSNGMSGGKPGFLTRKQYEMYGPAAYASYGTAPIFIASALNDYYAVFDGLLEYYNHLQCPKGLAVAPNRGHAQTSRNELDASLQAWCSHWQFQAGDLPKVHDGNLSVRDGHLIYSFDIQSAETPIYADVLFSYGKPGHWTGRAWHREAAKNVKPGSYEYEIPIYDPQVPLYAVAQVQTKNIGVMANLPQYIEPAKLGFYKADTQYPHMLLDFEDMSDLYIPVGTPAFVNDAPHGKVSAAITPYADGTVQLVNIEPIFWKGAKELHFFLKGDGKPGPLDLFFSSQREYWYDPKVNLVLPENNFETGWKEYVVPLDTIANLDDVSTLVFSLPGRMILNIDAVSWK